MRCFYCDCHNNWGDNFTNYLLRKIYGLELTFFEPSDADPRTADVFGIGSVLEYVPDGFKGHVLGSGFMFDESRRDFRSACVHILRGKLTRMRCAIDQEPVLGDLGLLADLFVSADVPKEYEYGIIPHYVDRDDADVVRWSRFDEALVIDIRCGIRNVLKQTASCKRVVSSSLHGLVVADALNVPNQWVRFSEKVNGGRFKFLDYYSVFDEDPVPAIAIAEAFNMVRTRDSKTVVAVKARLREALDTFADIARSIQGIDLAQRTP